MREPNCPHKTTVMVSSHEDLVGALGRDEPIASAYCCEREKCLDKHKFWVQGVTGRPAVVIARRRVS